MDDGKKKTQPAKKKVPKKTTQKSKKAVKKAKKKKDPFGSVRLLKSSLLYQVKEFFENSTLHGVRYIAEEGRPFFERFMWFSFVVTGGVAAIVIIFSLWEKFQTNPTITGLDTDFHNQEVIFPTVMVCPLVPYDDALVRSVSNVTVANYESVSEEYEPFLQIMTQLSYGVMDEALTVLLNVTAQRWRLLKQDSWRKMVFKMAVQCDHTFAYCRYKDETIDCCGYFKPVYTEHGFCYSFNSRYISQGLLEERTTEVQFLYETDKKWGLTFAPLLQSNVFVHSHNEISGWDFRPQVQWDVNFAIDFLISMKQTYTTEDARQLSIGQRKCIFPDEVKLKYYNDDYTFSGCMKECRIDKCLRLCRCIPWFYAPAKALQYCNVTQLACMAKFAANITSISGCQHCELGCHNTVYDIEKYSKVMTTDDSKEPVVTIEYLTWPIIRYKREVLFGWVDLLVSFGGIAGLFLGFSLLSGVEIIYFFTMRACCMLYKNRDELIAIEQEKAKRPQHRYELGLRPELRNRVGPEAPADHNLLNNSKNVITIGLIEQEFQAVKVPEGQGLLLTTGGGGGAREGISLSRRHLERHERMRSLMRPNFFQPINVGAAPYSERIKPLDRNVVRTKDGLFYNGYLP